MSEKFSIASTTSAFFADKKGYIFLYLFLSFSYPLGNILVPHYYGKLIEEMVAKTDIKRTFLVTMGLWITSICGINGMTKIDNKIIPEFRSYLYTKIAEFVFNIYKENYSAVKGGELISKLSKLPYLILEIFYQIRTSYLPLIYMIIFSLFYFFSINSKLGSLVLGFIILSGIIAYWSWSSCVSCCTDSETDSDKTNEDLQDILENILNVYTSNNVEEEMREFVKKNKENQKHFKKCLKCSSKFKFLFSTINISAFCIIAMYMYRIFQEGQIKLSQINSAFIVMIYLLSQMDSTLQYFQETITYIGSIIDIQNYIDTMKKTSQAFEEKIVNYNSNLHTQPVDKINGRIEFRNIDICFEENCILKNFSYIIEPGDRIAVVGPVGRGKSSLLKMILKLVYPSGGQVLIDGMNLPYDVIRNFVSYIPQAPLLFNRTLYQNITYGLSDISEENVITLMRKYGLDDIFGNVGLNDNVGKNGSVLSGGQKQLVILMRAILRNTPIILIDEGTTALDNRVRDKVVNLLFDQPKNKTIIMITHDEDILPHFQKILKV